MQLPQLKGTVNMKVMSAMHLERGCREERGEWQCSQQKYVWQVQVRNSIIEAASGPVKTHKFRTKFSDRDRDGKGERGMKSDREREKGRAGA